MCCLFSPLSSCRFALTSFSPFLLFHLLLSLSFQYFPSLVQVSEEQIASCCSFSQCHQCVLYTKLLASTLRHNNPKQMTLIITFFSPVHGRPFLLLCFDSFSYSTHTHILTPIPRACCCYSKSSAEADPHYPM